MRLLNRLLAILVLVLGMLAFGGSAAASLTYTFTSGTEVAVSGSNYTASGALNLTLGFAPTPGTNLTVVKNTGLPFISGTFDGVPQGMTIPLTYNGVTYNYIANYYGGNGRSLVLQWPCVGLAAWGYNGNGQLGTGDKTTSLLPIATISGALAGKTVVSIAAGEFHSLALTSDSQVFAWGYNGRGALGNATTTDSSVPVAVSSAEFTGKKVVAVVGGYSHSLALTSDGQVFAWGYNDVGQLGNNSAITSSVPVSVSASGLLAGKTVVAISAGGSHSLALTSIGQVYAWGNNSNGQLGNGGTTNSPTPVLVSSGALAGKTVVAIAAGEFHSLALTSDGQVFAWGYNNCGELGNNSTTQSLIPVAVTSSGVLAGMTVVAIAAGASHSMALTSDGRVVTWGDNYYAQLGNNSTTNSTVPVWANMSGVMAGKKVSAISGGRVQSVAMTTDGKVFSWGCNDEGELGNNSTTSSSVPVEVNAGTLVGSPAVAVAAGFLHNLVMVGPEVSVSPSVTANPANATLLPGATANFTATATGKPAPTVQWQVSTTGITGTFSNITGNATATTGALALTDVTLAQNGYAYQAVFTNSAGSSTTTAATLTVSPATPFVTSNPVNQKVLLGMTATFTATAISYYEPTVQWQVSTTGTDGTFSNITGNPTATTGTLKLPNFTLEQNGYAYRAIFTNSHGSCTTTAATLMRANEIFASSTDVPMTINNVSVSGSLAVALGFEPKPGTNLTVIKNTGPAFISGTFDGVPQGETVPLTYNGKTYNYIANYYGGNGRSLVLQWPCSGIDAWGANANGQLGNNNTTDSPLPVSVIASEALGGKTLMAISGGGTHSMVLTSDGLVFDWGFNFTGQLGNNSTANSSVPVAVNTSGTLAGKTVVSIAAGYSHSMALTSEGQVFAWGFNGSGQLGNNSTTNSSVPVAVSTSGILSGKTISAIAANCNHSLALTSDGKVVAWGYNNYGELGNNSTANSLVPVAVSSGNGALADKTVIAIAAGGNYSLALTSDGQVFAWGDNRWGQLGNNTTTSSSVPVVVSVLAGKTVVAIAAGAENSLALTSEGQVFAWGFNGDGELGNGTTTNSLVPIEVSTLAGKTVVTIVAGDYHSLVLTSTGQIFTWGKNSNGELGNNTLTRSLVPVAVSANGVPTGASPVALSAGDSHSLVLFASGLPTVSANPASQTVTSGTTVNFTAASTDTPRPAVQWQVSTTGTAGGFSNIVGNPTATMGTLTLTDPTPAQNGYAYRAVFTNIGGSSATTAATLTVQRTFAWFQDQYGLPDPDPTADPNHTGVCQLAAYAFGVDPSVPDRSQLPSMALQDGYLQITYPRWKDSADLGYVVEVSDDLQTWYSGTSYTQPVSVTPIDAAREQVVERDPIPTSSAPRRFLRVRIVTH